MDVLRCFKELVALHLSAFESSMLEARSKMVVCWLMSLRHPTTDVPQHANSTSRGVCGTSLLNGEQCV